MPNSPETYESLEREAGQVAVEALRIENLYNNINSLTEEEKSQLNVDVEALEARWNKLIEQIGELLNNFEN